MRFEDITDYLRYRKLTENPMEILRFRKRQMEERELHVRFRERPHLYLRGGREDFHMFHRIYMRDEYRLNPFLRQGLDCVIDLGGNVGLFASRVAPYTRKVITCEPMPENYARLERNLRGWDHVIKHNWAVSDRKKTMRLYRPYVDRKSGIFSFDRQGREHVLSDEYIEVEAVGLPDLMELHNVDPGRSAQARRRGFGVRDPPLLDRRPTAHPADLRRVPQRRARQPADTDRQLQPVPARSGLPEPGHPAAPEAG